MKLYTNRERTRKLGFLIDHIMQNKVDRHNRRIGRPQSSYKHALELQRLEIKANIKRRQYLTLGIVRK